ncbi:MAG: class I SAM-dependent methyltransferase [Myxococcota bacterium]
MSVMPKDEIRDVYASMLFKSAVVPEDDVVFRTLVRFLPSRMDTAIVDAACGDGRYARKLASMGYTQIKGVDLYAPEKVDQKDGFTYQQGDMRSLPAEQGEAGLVMCLSAIYYLDQPEDAIAEFARACAPGGYVYLTGPTRWSLFTLQRRIKRKMGLTPHLNGVVFRSTDTYQAMLEKHGFEVVLRDGFRVSMTLDLYSRIKRRLDPHLSLLTLPQVKAVPTQSPWAAHLKSNFAYHFILVGRKR